ncbi:hypothetical protein APHNP_1693 [Anaplasma phagocytophilum str. ApNP]|uniref:Uncharacterized protein n=1 Tax=Anaplasma phagocytophilum str. ApNP TaxID=1359153 RepID=A0A0F3NE73_ANAPH|nr:hypothetical protein APHNP_1693 [Anaplasma phagocytophilum str. ApNP]KJV82946.1 hypothetical protein APHHGE2_0740 [Anaplasma phagocytophilum str. HGE2]KJZ98056.1 hypothetical protein APHDU1_1263 [Anaplasma phagocytophilum]
MGIVFAVRCVIIQPPGNIYRIRTKRNDTAESVDVFQVYL